MVKAQGRIQIQSATVKFVFAPDERDVCSYSAFAKDPTPLGAKPGTGVIGDQAKAIALLQTFGVKKERHAINLSLLCAKRQTISVSLSNR